MCSASEERPDSRAQQQREVAPRYAPESVRAGGPSPVAPVAQLTHVTLRYESGTQALDDVTLSVKAGERLCILGANGSGKSTLASVLCGLLAPDEGAVMLVGEDVFDASREAPVDFEAYRQARRHLGLVFQNPDDQIVTTVVEEDVAFGPENLGVPAKEIGQRVERELRRVALTDYAKADPTRLSGGQKQRVAIAGALAMEPDLIVFDEPGSLLDVRGRAAILRVMGRLRDTGTTIVHITHFMEESLEADRVAVLDGGRIVLEGTPEDVFAHRETIARLGLEEPFAAQLSAQLGLEWTCDDATLEQEVLAYSGTLGGTDVAPGASGCVHFSSAKKPDAYTIGQKVHTAHPSADKTCTQPAVCAERVSFSYGRKTKALDDVSFELMAGSSLAIVGQTGSGKSTLLRLLCALEVPDEGRVLVGDICTGRKRDRRRLHGTIGYVMQHPERQLFAETVFADVAFGPTNLGLSHKEVQQRCADALELVGLRGLDDASPFELSGGQQRLCALAGILAMEPRVLVLDEPTAGLDPRGRRALRAILDDIHERGTTIVEVTHSMEDAAQAERIVVLDQAHVVLDGTSEQVFCADNEELLAHAGLGLPLPLSWAMRLERAGFAPLGAPLTLDELTRAIGSAATSRAAHTDAANGHDGDAANSATSEEVS